MVAGLQGAPMAPSLTGLSSSHVAASDQQQAAVVTWQRQSIRFHAVLKEDEEGAGGERPGGDPQAALVALAGQLLGHADEQQQRWLLVDADDCQLTGGQAAPEAADPTGGEQAPAGITCASCRRVGPAAAGVPPPRSTSGGSSLFERLVEAAPPLRTVALVQNVHFLPCGPTGTSQRTPGLLQARAWSTHKVTGSGHLGAR